MTRKPKLKGKDKKLFGNLPSKTLLLCASGGVLVLLAVIVGAVLFLRGDGKQQLAAANARVPNAGVPDADAPLAVAPERPAEGLSATGLVASATAPPHGDWNVATDGVDAPAGFASIFTAGVPMGFLKQNNVAIPRLLFARPDSGQAAIVVSDLASPIPTWLRYDLRKPPHPLAVINLGGAEEKKRPFLISWEPADLNPNGTRLAIIEHGTNENGRPESVLSVWSADGELVMEARENREKHFLWAGFLNDNSLAVLTAGGDLEVRDLQTGTVASQQHLGWEMPIAFSPGRNWLVGYTGNGFEWRRLSDAKPEGTLMLPSGLPADRSAPAIAVSQDGAMFAAYFQAAGQHVVLTWDIASGAVKDAVLYPLQEAPAKALRIQWAGPRAILIAGTYLLDLDLRLPVWGWAKDGGNYWDKIVAGPDWRFWRAGALPDGDKLWNELSNKAPSPPQMQQPTFLFAGSPLPDPVMEHVKALRDGFVLNYNQPVRAEAQGTNGEFRAAVADALATFLSSHEQTRAGDELVFRYAIDPTAPTAIRLRLLPPEVRLVGKPQDAVAVVGGQRMGGSDSVRPEVVIAGRLEFIDKSGNVAWTSPRQIEVYEPITAAYSDTGTMLQKYPEAKSISNPAPLAVDMEAKYPQFLAAARKRFLEKLASDLQQSFPAKHGMRAALFFPAGDEPRQPIATGEMTVEGLPAPPPPDRNPTRLPVD